jgi:hypothetical protein
LLTADYEGNIEYQAVTSTGERDSVRKFAAILASWLATVRFETILI